MKIQVCYAAKYVELYKQTKILGKLLKNKCISYSISKWNIKQKDIWEKKIPILDSLELRLGIKSLSRYLQS